MQNWMHSTPWMHNDVGKKHSFYKRSPEEEHRLAQTMSSMQWGSDTKSGTRLFGSP